MSTDISRVGVVGGGQMGAGIAEVCARAGLDTVVCEVDAVAARTARERVAASLDRAVRRGKLDRATAREALARTVLTGSLDDLADRQLVIEAVIENPDAKTEVFAGQVLGKTVIRSQDRAGFVVNALLVPYLLSAIRIAESGFATAGDIDAGMELGCAHPMGPLKLADLIGLDTVASIAESLYAEFREPLYAPPPLLQRMVEAGLLGRKTGRGFHTYDQG
ncbi:3-hydroxybutyryl-CoA dehydrogenase [Streptomyces sp. SID2563]|uniref:3-hydroxyacyl-CoA dehydrogenase family protein n=1 Tax=Streptomyces sp. SID2563 TaxID=2690255 RepID=UPI00136979B0|nr:3-hydroxyacyl-CoA dehydrogenase family protein [Streptomyces sp. SID2563]MYW12998.1 3-hydroxybutyryl-CoA dehydrogenase [Streptomyces sp. SID2563]